MTGKVFKSIRGNWYLFRRYLLHTKKLYSPFQDYPGDNKDNNRIDYLEKQISLETSLGKLHPIESDIMTLARQRGKVTNSMVVAAYGHNPNTVKSRFRNLVSAGVLKAVGTGKGRYYVVA